MINSTTKASGKLEKGIIAIPDKGFLKEMKQPFRFQQTYVTCKESDTQNLQKAEAYDFGFDEMPI